MDTGIIITLAGVLVATVTLYFLIKWNMKKTLLAQLAAQDKLRKAELEPIQKQLENHIPSEIKETKSELKADIRESEQRQRADAKETKSELKADIRESEQRQRADAKEREQRIIDRITELFNAHPSKQ